MLYNIKLHGSKPLNNTLIVICDTVYSVYNVSLQKTAQYDTASWYKKEINCRPHKLHWLAITDITIQICNQLNMCVLIKISKKFKDLKIC